MSKRMKTGINGLDTVLEGGFLYHNSILIKGQPGSGKTTLGIQTIWNGVTQFNETGIIILFEQFPQQLYRDLASYSWDMEKMVQDKKIVILFPHLEDIAGSLQRGESPLISQIHTVADEIGARRILIDGISNFIRIIKTEKGEREIFLRFINAIKSIGLTPIITAESNNIDEPGFEDYLTDCVITLSSRASVDPTFQLRQLEVRKTRGHGHVRGKHPYRITSDGIVIYPHLPPKPYSEKVDHTTVPEKIPSGVNGLDPLLEGGFTKGAATVMAGMPGAFKTTLGVQFLETGANNGEPGLLITMEESPQQLAQNMKPKGLDLEPHLSSGAIQIWHYFPKYFYMEELQQRLEQALKNGVQRVVVDSINEIERSIEDPATYKDYIVSMLELLERYGATAIFLQKLDKFTANAPLTDIRYASAFDDVIYAGAIEIESAVRKVISILKTRGGAYQSDLREICCDENGLEIRGKFVGMSGILAGNPQGQYKQTVEEIFQPLYFVRDFLEMMSAPGMPEEQRAKIANDMIEAVNKLVDRLREYFDIQDDSKRK